MFLSTKSQGVRRSSLVVELLAAAHGVVEFHRSEFYHSPEGEFGVVSINLVNTTLVKLPNVVETR